MKFEFKSERFGLRDSSIAGITLSLSARKVHWGQAAMCETRIYCDLRFVDRMEGEKRKTFADSLESFERQQSRGLSNDNGLGMR